MVRVVGNGSFGIVRECRSHIDGQTYAIKSIPLQSKKFQYA